MSRIARISLFAVGGVVALLALLMLLAWVFLDAETVRHRIEQTASQAMGMEFKVDGPVQARVFPTLGVGLTDVHVRQGETEWLHAAEMRLRVRLLPLLRGRVEISAINFVEPGLNLTRDSDGAFNFIPAHRPDDAGDRQPFGIRRFSVEDASLTFIDQPSGDRFVMNGCDLAGRDLAWPPAQSPQPNPTLPDFHGQLNCRSITYGTLDATEVQAAISAQGQRLTISPLTGRLFGGRLKVQLESDLSGSSPAHSLELELADFRVERFIETFRQEQGAEGSAGFSMQLTSSGRSLSEVVEQLDGQAELAGEGLVLHGTDLDAQLARYESTQQFNLVDTAALFLAGPVGLAVTQGYGFASLFAETGGRTSIQELISEWHIENGVARAHDVALSTEENRLALAGRLNFVTSEFEDMRVAVIDSDGCAVVEQRIQGSFNDPRINKPNFVVALTAPLFEMVKQGVALFSESECEPFYSGRVVSP
ncbi:AsmA family protein [Thiohalobacter thiocyanaticus]|nr:AsmA family protein [Thiohalobacter thiocyanaticus]